MEEQIAEWLGKIVRDLLLNDFVVPVHFAAIAKTGFLIAGRFDIDPEAGGLMVTVEGEGMSAEPFAAPVNVVFFDGNGKAARLLIDDEGSIEVSQ